MQDDAPPEDRTPDPLPPEGAPVEPMGASVLVAGVALVAALWLQLLAALFGALASYVLFRAVRTRSRRLGHWQGTFLTTLLVVALFAGAGLALFEGFELLFGADSGGLAQLLRLMADTLDRVRSTAPDWLAQHLPDSAAALQEALSHWLRQHAREMQHWGHEGLRLLVHLILGIAIGILVGSTALRDLDAPVHAPLPRQMLARWNRLSAAFADVFAAQVRIALVNSALTGIYLLGVLPLLGLHVPLGVTLVALSFFLSLIPIVGNLLSNTAIVFAALTVSPWLAAASLAFLVIVHKLEYFLNAHFVGNRIRLPAWALLVSMLVLEAAFGAGGVVAAPVYCAWLTRELRASGWI